MMPSGLTSTDYWQWEEDMPTAEECNSVKSISFISTSDHRNATLSAVLGHNKLACRLAIVVTYPFLKPLVKIPNLVSKSFLILPFVSLVTQNVHSRDRRK